MREMRDSGVEWIGEIPKDWNCCKQKYRFTLINGRAFKDNEFEEDGTYRILRVGNLFSNPVWYSSSLELEPDKYCEKGDLIYAWSMSYGPYIWNEEKVIYHYHIWKTKLVSDMDKMFSYYYLQALTESIKSQTHETTMGFVTMGIMNNSYIAYPRNIKEQKKITARSGDDTIRRIIMIPTSGFPDDRESAAVNSVVKDRASFVEYIAFVLGDDYVASMLEGKQMGESGFFANSSDAMPALYEKMLKTSVEGPERIKDIGYVLKMVTDKDIIPDEFRELYETFCNTLKIRR